MTKQWKFKFVGYLPFEAWVHVSEGEDHDGRPVEDEFAARDAAWDYILDNKGHLDPKIGNWTTEEFEELDVP